MLKNLIALSEQSKVWIYQADRDLSDNEVSIIKPKLVDFLQNWTSHNQSLITFGEVFHNRFLCLMVDETLAGASGCSIDSSVHFIQALGEAIKVDFFDRMNFCYLENQNVNSIHASEMKQAYESGVLTADTLFFDNLVNSKREFQNNWLKPLKNSWHKKFI